MNLDFLILNVVGAIILTQEEIKKIIDDITGNYKLLIALYVLNEFEKFPWMKEHYTFEEEYDSRVKNSKYLKNNATAFSWYTEEVIQILEEIYGFKSYTLSFEASYYLNW